MREDRTGESLIQLIDSLTTNFTSFLREPAHFEFLTDTAANEFGDRASLRIWSAACSSGEEPYSIAMTLLDRGASRCCVLGFRICASWRRDISTRVLKKAELGIYEGERFKGIPESWWRSFLLKGKGRFEGSYRLKPAVATGHRIRAPEPDPAFSAAGAFISSSAATCSCTSRRPTQQDIVQRLARCLEPGGYFLVGHSETLHSIDHALRYLRPAVYRRELARTRA